MVRIRFPPAVRQANFRIAPLALVVLLIFVRRPCFRKASYPGASPHAVLRRRIGPYADKKQETFATWKAGIAGLGKCQNVVVKLGGLGMLFGMFDFHTR